jgi:DNA-binding NarL/FixJ family response regulator
VLERASAPTESVSGTHAIRVVVVDDEALVRSGFSLILGTAADIEIVSTATGGDAVAAVREHRPDVVLLDIRMPDVDGLTVLQQLLALPAPPVVAMLTTFDTDEYVLAALNIGAAGFLLKDTDPDQLAQLVRTLAAGGVVMSPKTSRTLLRAYPGTEPAVVDEEAARVELLTARERDVLVLLAEGLSNVEIGTRLYRGPGPSRITSAPSWQVAGGQPRAGGSAGPTGQAARRRPGAARGSAATVSTGLKRLPRRIPAPLVDAAVVALAAFEMSLNFADGTRIDLALALVAVAALALRRRFPLVVFLFTLPATLNQEILVPPIAALYTLGERSGNRRTLAVCATLAAVAMVIAASREEGVLHDRTWTLLYVVYTLAAATAPVLLGQLLQDTTRPFAAPGGDRGGQGTRTRAPRASGARRRANSTGPRDVRRRLPPGKPDRRAGRRPPGLREGGGQPRRRSFHPRPERRNTRRTAHDGQTAARLAAIRRNWHRSRHWRTCRVSSRPATSRRPTRGSLCSMLLCLPG